MNVGGIDGCKGGWLIARHVKGNYDLELYENFASLIAQNNHLERILIDIPIGLSSINFNRTIDSKMRRELRNRHSTVFNAPCRPAVYEPDACRAKMLNIQIENKSLSVQSLLIRDKIKEVDEYLCENKNKNRIVESHPELCFKYLNNSIVQSKKANATGIHERLEIFRTYDPALVELYDSAQKEIKRKYAKRDDIVDALCLCLVNKLGGKNELYYLEDNNRIDEKGIKIRIAYFQQST
jgi:8-oxo-dGTP diphosphatase